MIREPPRSSAALSTPPSRRARPPARIAAETRDRTLDIITPPPYERTPYRTSARGQPSSIHRGSAADPPGILRELAQRLRPSRGHDRARAAVGGAQFSARGRGRLQPRSRERAGEYAAGVDDRQRGAVRAAADSRAAHRAAREGGASDRARRSCERPIRARGRSRASVAVARRSICAGRCFARCAKRRCCRCAGSTRPRSSACCGLLDVPQRRPA